MNVEHARTASWSRQRWAAGVLLALAAQLGLIALLSHGRPIRARAPRPETHLRLMQARQASPAGLRLENYTDPLLFALVAPCGFSGPAWLTFSRSEYYPTNAPQPMHWLGLPPEELADDFSEFVQTNVLTEDLIAGPLLPMLGEPAQLIPTIKAGCAVRLEGGLADRRLLTVERLPVPAEAILTPSVVRVLVDGTGRTISAALLSSCGMTQADQDALAFARRTRFSRVNGASAHGVEQLSPFTFGNLVFQWSHAAWGGLSGTATELRKRP